MNNFDDVMKSVCEISLQQEIEKMKGLDIDSIVCVKLSNEQINKLAEKINLLPFEYQNIIFFRYCFNETPSETEKILEIKNVKGNLYYIKKLLSDIMNLEGTWIDDQSLGAACKIALLKNLEDYEGFKELKKPNYSDKFRMKLKHIETAQKPKRKFFTMSKKVAMFALICVLSFSAFMAVNAEVREKFLDWVIETFPEFSIFSSQNINKDNDSADLSYYKINYIPDRFELEEIYESRRMLIYNYVSEDNKTLSISFYNGSEHKFYYDTENVKIEKFTFDGFPAYLWQTDEMINLICQHEKIECHITGNVDKEEILKVAENISK